MGGLGVGEQSTIANALHMGINLVILNHLLARKTLGSLPSLRSAFLDLLSAGTYASRSLLNARLRVVGEPSISSL